MEWFVRQPAAQEAFDAWLDVDATVDPSLVTHVLHWIENELAVKGPDQGLKLFEDGDSRTILVPMTKVRVKLRADYDNRVIDIRSIGRPGGGGSPI